MFRAFAIAIAAIVIAGCSTSAEVDNPFKGDDGKNQLVAFAAKAEYPNKQASDDQQLTALVNRKEGNIKVINTSNQAMSDAKVWVNGTYVTKVDSIPARGMITLHRENFYDRNGVSLSKASASITKVQLESGDKFYNLQGPAMEQ